jgi:integrase
MATLDSTAQIGGCNHENRVPLNAACWLRYNYSRQSRSIECLRHLRSHGRAPFNRDLRAALVDLRWSQVNLEAGTLHTNRGKDGENNNHRLDREELKDLRKLRAQNPHGQFVFVSERGKRFSTAGFAKMVERAGRLVKLPFKVHPHQLRHACGFNLAATGADTRAIQGYLGHRSIKSTEIYTALSPARFNGFSERLRGR